MQTSLIHRVVGLFVMALVFGFAGLASAGGTASHDALDANGDGAISAEEAQADPVIAEKFNELDVDYDGQLNEAEFARFEAQGEAESQTEDSATEEESPGGIY